MKKWVIFATLSAIAGAASAVLPYMSKLSTVSNLLAERSAESQSTAAMMLAALGMMAVIVVRRSGK
ncbi:hypothetical protein [Rhodoferax sp.]|uniref:hypothetical protein n=1 Tax=Rhodoferax sp. TaxID=50421 RepID=UPI0025E16FED|nr:hypothetical protein [Rhodoferax sp.]